MSTKPPSGTRDFLPSEIRRREYVLGVVREVYERYGFEPLETPAFENIETLLGKYGEEGSKLIFKILRRGEHEASGQADLALRYDLTVPLARVIAQYQSELPKFFKRYQIQPVWRADRPAKGRFREFFQCDVDAIGSASPIVEVEVIAAVCDVLTTLGFDDFVVRLNHRALLDALLERSGVPASLVASALVAIDKRDKIGRDGVIEELVMRGVGRTTAVRCVELMTTDLETRILNQLAGDPGFNTWILDHLAESVSSHKSGTEALDELRKIRTLSHGTSAFPRIAIDPSLARGLSYYTGAIMEIAVSGLAGSLGGGGRYDNLIGMFLGRDVPACGFSLGLERILVVMTERNMFPVASTAVGVDVMVTVWNQQSRADSLALASQLRGDGLKVDVYPDPDKVGKQLKYAADRGIPFVTIVGDDERASGQVSVKNLGSGQQQSVSRNSVGAEIQRLKLARAQLEQ